MLRITIAETATEKRWTLHGRLVGPWVGELRTVWKETHRTQSGRTRIVDLNAVTFIDKGGEELLRVMSREGAQFIANGLYIKHVLEELKMGGKCALSGITASFFAALLLSVIVFGPSTPKGSEVGKMNAKHDARTQVKSRNAAHAPDSPTPLFNGKEDQDYARRLPSQDR